MFSYFLFADVLCSSCHVPQELFTVIFWLGYCNSLMNPVIYASSSREFKRAFLRVIRCQFKRNPRLFLNTDCTSAEFHKWRNSVNEMRKSSSDYKPRVSFTGSQQSENDDLMQINETTFSVNRRNSESPMASLRVLPNHRRSFSRNVSSQLGEQRSSISDLADDEQSDMSSYHSESTVKQAVIKVPSNSKISSFTKDENYIDAFKNNRSQTVL